MRKEILERTNRWIKKAEKDLLSAKKLLEAGIYDYSLFHSEQAVEKYLKAVLTYYNIPFQRTHNILKLVRVCSAIDKDYHKLKELNLSILFPLGIEVRYPEAETEITEQDAREAIDVAEKVRNFILRKLNIKNL